MSGTGRGQRATEPSPATNRPPADWQGCPCRVSFQNSERAWYRTSSAGQPLGPVVALQERIGLDRGTGAPFGVDQPVRRNLADQCRLGDVVVFTVDRDSPLRSFIAHAICRL